MIIVLILLKLASLKPVRKRWLWMAVMLGIVLFAPIIKLYAATAFTGCGGEFVAATNAQAEAQVVVLVNEERAKVGLPPYKMVPELTEAARYHSADMAADRYRDHYTKDRDANDTLVTVCTWNTRVKKYYPTYDQFTENVGNGTSSPSVIMTAWMNSTGHKANILGDYREIGVGYDKLYWTQDFTTRYDVYPVVINHEAQQSTSATVSLYLYGSWTEMRLRNDGGAWGPWEAFQNELNWTLPNQAGTRLVEVEMRDAQNTVSSSDTIDLMLTTQTSTPTATQTSLPTATNTALPTVTVTPTATPTAIVDVTATPTATPTAIVAVTATATATAMPPTPQAVPSLTPTLVSSTVQLIYLPVVQR